MSATILDVEQGSAAWHDARRGIVTASVVGQLVTARRQTALEVDCPKCGAAAGDPCSGARVAVLANPHPERADTARTSGQTVIAPADNLDTKALALLLASERITGWTEDTFISSAMERGQMDEPLARDLYSRTYAPVAEAGLITLDLDGAVLGYSPDGLVGDDGLIEVKSRAPKKHLATILADTVPPENMAQIQAGLLVTGRAWCDYLDYTGGMPMWRKRVYPDPAWHNAIIGAVVAMEATIAQMIATYTSAVEGLPETERIDYSLEMEIH